MAKVQRYREILSCEVLSLSCRPFINLLSIFLSLYSYKIQLEIGGGRILKHTFQIGGHCSFNSTIMSFVKGQSSGGLEKCIRLKLNNKKSEYYYIRLLRML